MVRVRCSAHRPPRSKRGTLLHELHPGIACSAVVDSGQRFLTNHGPMNIGITFSRRRHAEMMFSVPKDQVRWIDEIDFKADFSGIIPELKDWMDAKCNKDTDMEKRLWKIFDEKIARGETFSPDEEVIRQTLGQKLKVRVECEGNTMDKLREDAWKAFQASKKSPFPWPF
jgi:hypothetical protein